MGNFLLGFALYHARYVFIKVTNDIVYYREGGRQYCFMSLSALLFDRLGSSACCHWTAENLDHILEFGGRMNLDSLQEGLIPERKRFPEAISLSLYTGLQRAAKQSACQHHKREHVYSDHLAKNKTYQPTLARTKDILVLAETLDTKTEGQNWSIKYNILNQARQQLFYLW